MKLWNIPIYIHSCHKDWINSASATCRHPCLQLAGTDWFKFYAVTAFKSLWWNQVSKYIVSLCVFKVLCLYKSRTFFFIIIIIIQQIYLFCVVCSVFKGRNPGPDLAGGGHSGPCPPSQLFFFFFFFFFFFSFFLVHLPCSAKCP